METIQRFFRDPRVLYGLMGLVVIALIVATVMCTMPCKSGQTKNEPFVDLRKLGNAHHRQLAEEIRFI